MPAVKPLLMTLQPDAIVTVDPVLPTDPPLRAVVDEVVTKLRYAFAVAAAGDDSHATGRADQVFSEFLASRSPVSRAAYREGASRLLTASASMRTAHFGRYATVDPKQYRAVGSEGIVATVGTLPLDGAAVRKTLTGLSNRTLQDIAPADVKAVLKLPPGTSVAEPESKPKLAGLAEYQKDFKAGLAFKKMKLFITSVKCIEETDELGSDTIAMGGSAVDTVGDTHIVGDFEVHDDFDSGDKKDLGFTRTFFTWDIATKPEGFPYVYGALIVMAEKDDGGFYKMLKELWNIVSADVTIAIGAAVGIGIGAAVSGVFAPLGAVIGAAIGAIIGWLVSIIEDNLDDFIDAKPVLMTLATATKSYYDWAKLTSPQGWTTTIKFKGDGGIYEVGIAYRIFV
jgi:hypothetical protein